MIRRPPRSSLCPYTTLFRAGCGRSASPVRREGQGSIPCPYPYRWSTQDAPSPCAWVITRRPDGRLSLRLEEPVKTFSPQPGFEFVVAGSEPPVQMQSQGDEGRILRVHVPAQATGLHPGSDGDAAFLHEMDPGEKFVKAFQQSLFAQFSGLGDPLLVLEKLDEDEARAVERRRAVGQESLAQGGLSTQQQGEENVGVNDDAGRVHSPPSGVKRRSFACHQSDLMSSDSFQAASGVSRLRRPTLSTRSQEPKSLTSPGVMPSVGIVTCKQPFSALTAIMVELYNAKAGLSKRGLPAVVHHAGAL